MKVILNKYIPFSGFVAMAFYNMIFWRKEYEYKMSNKLYYNTIVNHESIHESQMRDFCKWIPVGGTIFYIIYVLEWLFRVLFTKDFFSYNAYRNLSFEKEAKSNEKNMEYINTRKKFAQWKKNKWLKNPK